MKIDECKGTCGLKTSDAGLIQADPKNFQIYLSKSKIICTIVDLMILII